MLGSSRFVCLWSVFRPLLGAALVVALVLAEAQPLRGETAIDFGRQVRPILAKHCYACHGPDKAESGLSLAEFDKATAAGDSGEIAIKPGAPHASELMRRVTSDDASLRMPPEGEGLSPEKIAILKQWIEEGAEYKAHWSFQPISRPQVPEAEHPTWSMSPIDRFLLKSLTASGLQPNPAAPRRTVVRRLFYSLLGVPPTIEEVERFEKDSSEWAYEELVDRLLADPRFGERWARHWLDVVRYAETNSFERDGPKPNAWKYRDYVIRSFNQDKPYDRFLREQIAGDELAEVTVETLTATGFYRLGLWDDEPADPLLAVFDGYDDLVTVTGQGILGLTFNCARCHDHKVDPIPQQDYYQMVAFFRDVQPYGVRGNQSEWNQIEISSPELREQYQQLDAQLAKLRKDIRAVEQKGIARMKGEDQRKTEGRQRKEIIEKYLNDFLEEEERALYARYKAEEQDLQGQLERLPEREFVLGVAKNLREPPETKILLRGSPLAEGPGVVPGFPKMTGLPAPIIPPPPPEAGSSGRRTVLANWLTSSENWFTARVIVNRLWQHHFGRGIVRSANNFGQLGDAPTHPELLDWLATELIRHEWNLKPIHRMLVLSQAYQMASDQHPAGIEKDPANQLFWHYPMRRLSAEEIRDSILATSGELNLRMHGPSIYPELAAEVKAGQSRPGSGWKDSPASERARRSVYIYIKRSLIPPELSVFDFPETDTSCEARFLTTQAAQALGLLNGKFIQDQSQRFAERVRREAGQDRKSQIRRAIELAYGRVASEADLRRGESLMDRLAVEHSLDADRQLKEFCLVLLNTNEFMYLD